MLPGTEPNLRPKLLYLKNNLDFNYQILQHLYQQFFSVYQRQ